MARRVETKVTHNFERHGSFGVFATGDTIPLYYIQTVFKKEQLSYLTLARDLSPEGDYIDFELLIQRDIDEQRAREGLVPYLEGKLDADEATYSEPIFFPPLLVAVVPVKNNEVVGYFPSLNVDPGEDGALFHRWGNHIELKHYFSQGDGGYTFSLPNHFDSYSVDQEPVAFRAFIAPKTGSGGVKLVAIDGQHRLFALQDIAERRPDLVEDLAVPVCIVMPPLSYETASQNVRMPAYRVYRKLFVDVNSTMERVGGHFYVLLSDSTLSGLVCRAFCDAILSESDKGLRDLALVEWNTKSAKEASRILRPWTIANIKVLDLSFEKSFGLKGRYAELDALFELSTVNDELLDEGDEKVDEELPEVSFNEFTARQKEVLEDRARRIVVPALFDLIWGLDGFAEKRRIFFGELDEVKEKARRNDASAAAWACVYDHIVRYIEANPRDSAVRSAREQFTKRVRDRIEARVSPLFGHAIFHRAVIEAWSLVIGKCSSFGVHPSACARGLSAAWNEALGHEAQLFEFRKDYIQGFIFDFTAISPQEQVRKGMAELLVGILINEAWLEKFMLQISAGEESDILRSEIKSMAKDHLESYLHRFREAKKKRIRQNYEFEQSIDEETKAKLRSYETEYKRDRAQVDQGRLNADGLRDRFSPLVERLAENAKLYAKQQMETQFGSETELLEGEEVLNTDDEYIEEETQ